MPRLLTLGGLTLAGLEKPSNGVQPQRSRLALLAVLAAAGERGMPRDKLLALFWSDRDAEHARNALNQAAFVLRRDLGENCITGDSGTLKINERVIESDIADFNAAFDRRDWDAVARLHVAPFLDGIYLKEASEFERWADAERSRAFDRFRAALMELATAADSRGDGADAVRWWKRLVAADPLSSRAAHGYVSALAVVGDRAAAIAFVRIHESLLRQELDVALEPSLADLVARLRAETAAAARAGTPPPSRDGAGQSLKDGLERARGRYADRVRSALSARFEIEAQVDQSPVWTAFRAHPCEGGASVLLRVFQSSVMEAIAVETLVATLRPACEVRHRNILQLRDVDIVGEWICLVSDLPPALSLRDHLRREPQLSVRDAISIAAQLAAALEAAHAKALLHLDVRPRHIYLDDGRVVLRDVGIAPALSAATTAAETQSGLISLGTPAYMSPEHINPSGRLDERSDIYSLGCVFYQMLAGLPPFGGGPPSAMLTQRLVEPAPPVQRDGLPAKLHEILAAMLARVPADRFGSASAVREALLEVATPK